MTANDLIMLRHLFVAQTKTCLTESTLVARCLSQDKRHKRTMGKLPLVKILDRLDTFINNIQGIRIRMVTRSERV